MNNSGTLSQRNFIKLLYNYPNHNLSFAGEVGELNLDSGSRNIALNSPLCRKVKYTMKWRDILVHGGKGPTRQRCPKIRIISVSRTMVEQYCGV